MTVLHKTYFEDVISKISEIIAKINFCHPRWNEYTQYDCIFTIFLLRIHILILIKYVDTFTDKKVYIDFKYTYYMVEELIGKITMTTCE